MFVLYTGIYVNSLYVCVYIKAECSYRTLQLNILLSLFHLDPLMHIAHMCAILWTLDIAILILPQKTLFPLFCPAYKVRTMFKYIPFKYATTVLYNTFANRSESANF
jgi:hypothetical protein